MHMVCFSFKSGHAIAEHTYSRRLDYNVTVIILEGLKYYIYIEYKAVKFECVKSLFMHL